MKQGLRQESFEGFKMGTGPLSLWAFGLKLCRMHGSTKFGVAVHTDWLMGTSQTRLGVNKSQLDLASYFWSYLEKSALCAGSNVMDLCDSNLRHVVCQ